MWAPPLRRVSGVYVQNVPLTGTLESRASSTFGRERGHRESCNFGSGWPDSEPGRVPTPIVHIFRALAELTRDQDVHVAKWLDEGAPMGTRSVVAGGHFPLRSSARVAEVEALDTVDFRGNHPSFKRAWDDDPQLPSLNIVRSYLSKGFGERLESPKAQRQAQASNHPGVEEVELTIVATTEERAVLPRGSTTRQILAPSSRSTVRSCTGWRAEIIAPSSGCESRLRREGQPVRVRACRKCRRVS